MAETFHRGQMVLVEAMVFEVLMPPGQGPLVANIVIQGQEKLHAFPVETPYIRPMPGPGPVCRGCGTKAISDRIWKPQSDGSVLCPDCDSGVDRHLSGGLTATVRRGSG